MSVPNNDVHHALMSYVDENVPWACMPFPGGTEGVCYVILKPHPKSMVTQVLKKIAHKAVTPPTKQRPDDAEIKMMTGLFSKMGNEFPMCSIGSTDHSATAFVIHYNGSVVLDYADPAFFDQLDVVLTSIKTSDGLSGSSSPPQNVAS